MVTPRKARIALLFAAFTAAAHHQLEWKIYLVRVETTHQFGLQFTSEGVDEGRHTLSALVEDRKTGDRRAYAESVEWHNHGYADIGGFLNLPEKTAVAIGEKQMRIVETGIDGVKREGVCCVE